MIIGVELESRIGSAIIGTGLVGSEVGATIFEPVIYTCNGLGTVSFFGYLEVITY